MKIIGFISLAFNFVSSYPQRFLTRDIQDVFNQEMLFPEFKFSEMNNFMKNSVALEKVKWFKNLCFIFLRCRHLTHPLKKLGFKIGQGKLNFHGL